MNVGLELNVKVLRREVGFFFFLFVFFWDATLLKHFRLDVDLQFGNNARCLDVYDLLIGTIFGKVFEIF